MLVLIIIDRLTFVHLGLSLHGVLVISCKAGNFHDNQYVDCKCFSLQATQEEGLNDISHLLILDELQSTRWLLYTEQAPSAWFHFALCGLVGIITAYCFVWISQYYTDYKYEPVRNVALSSTTGHGTNIIAGEEPTISFPHIDNRLDSVL